MDTKALAKLYHRLTARERLPLLLAAVGRKDTAEAERLTRTAPMLTFRLPDYHGLSEGLFALTTLHLMTQLELAARYWHGSGALAVLPRTLGNDAPRGPQHLVQAIRLVALELVTHAEGWKLFCGGLHIDPEWLLRDQPCYGLICRAQASARAVAFTPAEALAYLREQVKAAEGEASQAPAAGPEHRLETAEAIAQGLQEFLERRVQQWS